MKRTLLAIAVSFLIAGQAPAEPNKGMGAEDYPFFTTDPYIPNVYFTIGGTPESDRKPAAKGGSPVPSHHSPLFKITPEPAMRNGVEATVLAMIELMAKK